MRQNLIKQPKLIAERISLRSLKDSDYSSVSYLRTDLQINRFVIRDGAETKSKALEFIKKISGQVEQQKTYYWAITLPNSDQMIGSICLWNISNDHLSAELGYDLMPEFQSTGYMTEAFGKVLDFGFQILGLDRIDAYTHSDNAKSRALLKKHHFKINKDRKDADNKANVIYELKAGTNG